MCALYPCFSPIVANVAQERPPDDETVLASLARDIARQQTLLVDLRARERAVSKRITLYPLAAWLVYLGVWYFGFVSGGSAGRVKPRAVRVLPVFMGPIVCVFSMLFAVSVRVDGLTETDLWATGFYSSAESCGHGMRGRAKQKVRLQFQPS